MSLNKNLYIVIGILIAANISLVAFITFHPLPEFSAPPQVRGHLPADMLVHELGFDNEQRNQFNALQRELRERIIPYDDSIKLCKDSLFGLILENDSIESKRSCRAYRGFADKKRISDV